MHGGIKSLLIVATLARIPITAGTVTLTLHVVQDLGLGYFAAGMVGAAFTVGGSFGAPVMGRITDRKGLRPVLVLTTVAEVSFWTSAPMMPYWALLIAAVLGGFLALPAFAVARQSIAALAPESHRLPAFALDSITTELSACPWAPAHRLAWIGIQGRQLDARLVQPLPPHLLRLGPPPGQPPLQLLERRRRQ